MTSEERARQERAIPRMIELFDDVRDILVELHKAGARFAALAAFGADAC
ncbi:MAG TPA: hypothetical protein VHB79_04040 [Polyangiaceae bacterium]|nr:hypothetical protein [Polyangiaceae bacterium]